MDICGKSYSVLVTVNQDDVNDHMVAIPNLHNINELNDSFAAKGILHYENSVADGPDPFDIDFSIDQDNSIHWKLTAAAARHNHWCIELCLKQTHKGWLAIVIKSYLDDETDSMSFGCLQILCCRTDLMRENDHLHHVTPTTFL